MRIFLAAIAVHIFIGLHGAIAASIQMLPPMDNDGLTQPCRPGIGNKIITWDGATSLKCAPTTIIDDVGRVGIGTANPLSSIDVNGAVRAAVDEHMVSYYLPSAGAIRSNTKNGTNFFDLGNVQFRNGLGGNEGADVRIYGALGVGGDRFLGYPYNPIPDNGMIIQGRVGIGTNSPAHDFEVANAYTNASVRITAHDNTSANLQLYSASSSGWSVGMDSGPDQNFSISFDDSNDHPSVTALMADTSGKITIESLLRDCPTGGFVTVNPSGVLGCSVAPPP